jgi:cellulose synthase/poly-beta-1,6-N-acetylglucosamine synthase-like glycosyltransferase
MARPFVLLIYGFLSITFAAVGLYYGLIATERCLRTRNGGPPEDPSLLIDDHPHVTLQVPVYNEQHVVDRLLQAIAGLN